METTNQNHSWFGPGWAALEGMQIQAMTATALYGCIYCIVSAVFFIVPAVLALDYANAFEYDPDSFGQGLCVAILSVSVFVPFVVGLAIPGAVLTYGYYAYILGVVRAVREGTYCPGIEVFFSGFRPRVFRTAMFHGFLVTLGLFCCFIPGLFFLWSYLFAPFVRHDHPEFSVRESLRRSRALMKGRWGDYDTRADIPFIVILLFLFVPFIGIILFFTVNTSLYATYYESILRETEAETDEELELYDKCE